MFFGGNWNTGKQTSNIEAYWAIFQMSFWFHMRETRHSSTHTFSYMLAVTKLCSCSRISVSHLISQMKPQSGESDVSAISNDLTKIIIKSTFFPRVSDFNSSPLDGFSTTNWESYNTIVSILIGHSFKSLLLSKDNASRSYLRKTVF